MSRWAISGTFINRSCSFELHLSRAMTRPNTNWYRAKPNEISSTIKSSVIEDNVGKFELLWENLSDS